MNKTISDFGPKLVIIIDLNKSFSKKHSAKLTVD